MCIGAISVANRRSLQLPLGLQAFKECVCSDKICKFLFLCPSFKAEDLKSRQIVVKNQVAYTNCLMTHNKGSCNFVNGHSCKYQGSKPDDMHNRFLCSNPADRNKQSIGAIECETSFKLDEGKLDINHGLEIAEL